MSKLIPILSLALFLALPAQADDDDGLKIVVEAEARAGIPISGLRNASDVAALRKVLSQKLGTRAKADVVARVWITFTVEGGCKVTLVDIRRIVDKVARKRRIRLTLGDPVLSGRVELGTDFKRPHPTRVAQMLGKIGAIKGVTLEEPKGKSVKRIRMKVAGDDVRLSALGSVVEQTLALRAATAFNNVTWHGPAARIIDPSGTSGKKGKGDKKNPGGKRKPKRCPRYGPEDPPKMEITSQKPGHRWTRK